MSFTKFITRLAAALALLYALVIGWFYFNQRKLLFPAGPPRVPEITNAQLLRLDGGGAAFYIPAQPGQPTLAHFHGNQQQLADLAPVAERYTRRGLGFFAVEYPGYGQAEGAPSEPAIDAAAERALHYLHDTLNVPERDTVLYGQSLGTGVALEMAARGRGSRLVLIAPYTSIVAEANFHYPFLPARWLVKDRFDSFTRAPDVRQPVLIVHGTRDEVVPFPQGERLAARLPHATLERVEGGHHNDLFKLEEARLAARVTEFAEGR